MAITAPPTFTEDVSRLTGMEILRQYGPDVYRLVGDLQASGMIPFRRTAYDEAITTEVRKDIILKEGTAGAGRSTAGRRRWALSEPKAPVADPTRPVQPSTGMVLPHVEQRTTGVLDPTFYDGLDVKSQGPVAEALPQPPQNPAEYEYKMSTEGNPDGPQISNLTVVPAATSATVSFTTSEPGTTRIRGGTSPGEFTHGSPVNEDYVTEHSGVVPGLTPDTTYYVEVDSRDADGNMMGATTEFTTTAEGGAQ